MSTRAPRTTRTADARQRAAEVLARVEADRAFAAAALDAALDRAPALDPRDRGFATELVYGALRSLGALDAALGRHARDGVRSVLKLDPWTRAVLRVAAYQILALDRVPPRAAVSAAVDAIRAQRSAGLAGFANAVLRKVAADRPDPMPADARVDLAMRAVPDEVFSRITPLLGDDGARAHLRAALTHTSSLTLRAQTLRTSREALRDRLVEELPGATVTLGDLSPWSLRVEGAGDPTRAPSWREGLFSIQDEAAQAVAAMTEARPGMRVLDVCAGRGGKTAAIATMLAGDGVLHAVDLHPEKLAKAREELARLRLDDGIRFAAFAADLSVGLGPLAKSAPSEGYDVVLVDAPCSGLGTLARRPDAMLRLRDPAEFDALVASQRAILERVAPLVKVGGALVWAVCTLTREEGDGVIEDFARAHPAYFDGADARRVFTADRDGTDGFVAHRRTRAGAW